MNGGNYRKWYGNLVEVVNWTGEAKREYASHGGLVDSKNVKSYGISWNGICGDLYGFRIKPQNIPFSSSSPTIVNCSDIPPYATLCLLNSKVGKSILSALNPTLQLNVGEVLDSPLVLPDEISEIDKFAEKNIDLSRTDWDSFETSWDFTHHPLVRGAATVAEAYAAWEAECGARFNQLKANEEELNRIFIDIYGLQDELTPEVEDKDITVRKADFGRDIRSFISYAVGCMFGRYSLNQDGLMFAGGDIKDIYAYYVGTSADTANIRLDGKYTFGELGMPFYYLPVEGKEPLECWKVDADNVIPITDEEYFADDIVTRFAEFVKAVYGEETLEENLDYIAQALGNKGASTREVLRNYFLKDFYADHLKVYQKRPIYWLFDSGKQNGFKALIYMHRYNADTIGNLRVDYLHRMERIYESEINLMQDTIDNSSNAREVTAATKRKEKLQKQLKECREYDEKIGHLALSRIDIDLDDGVKVNYEKVQTANDGKKYQVLAKI